MQNALRNRLDRSPSHWSNHLSSRNVRLPLLRSTVPIAFITFLEIIPAATPLKSQQIPARALSMILNESTQGFTRIAGVRELGDQRVILVDANERSVIMLDRTLSSPMQVGRQGPGPGEYTRPNKITALLGDTTAVFDQSSARIVLILPNGEATASLSLLGGFPPGQGHTLAVALDRSGRLFGQATPRFRGSSSLTVPDSAPIERWHYTSSRRDTVAFIPRSSSPSTLSVRGGMVAMRASDTNPFGGAPEWTVSQDGTIAILTLSPYRVALVSPRGARTVGEPVLYEPVLVTEEHKDRWRAEQRRPRPITVARLDTRQTDVVTASFPVKEPTNWPRILPPVVQGSSRFSPDGNLWVQRTTKVGDPPTFDIFGPDANRISQITLPMGTRLVGFGARCVYVVRKDALDLEYLQRISTS